MKHRYALVLQDQPDPTPTNEEWRYGGCIVATLAGRWEEDCVEFKEHIVEQDGAYSLVHELPDLRHSYMRQSWIYPEVLEVLRTLPCPAVARKNHMREPGLDTPKAGASEEAPGIGIGCSTLSQAEPLRINIDPCTCSLLRDDEQSTAIHLAKLFLAQTNGVAEETVAAAYELLKVARRKHPVFTGQVEFYL